VVVVVTGASTTLLAYVMRWLRRYATTDDLTGALSRGAVLQRLDEELAEARRSGTTLAVVSADVDHFKAINDTRGHLAGDEVLTALVDGWKALLGPLDVVGRTGGDEFVLLLPGRDREAATRWVEEARAASVAPWSAGLALSCASDTARDLLDRADVALYAQKAAR
jgi:diguanylate cyclase (GGDEF)-like protein